MVYNTGDETCSARILSNRRRLDSGRGWLVARHNLLLQPATRLLPIVWHHPVRGIHRMGTGQPDTQQAPGRPESPQLNYERVEDHKSTFTENPRSTAPPTAARPQSATCSHPAPAMSPTRSCPVKI